MTNQLWTSALLATLAIGCGSEATPAPETPATKTETPAPPAKTSEKPGDDPTKSDINISDKIKQACGLSDPEAHFAYNSSQVRASDKATLKKLADCFATGPLKGQKMNLVGHADPRGESEYNMVLGGRRAENVGSALKGAGLPAGQLSTSSRGALDASGTDEAGWAKDRRVDVMLAE